MKHYFWQIKIPTYLGIIVLIVILGITIFVLKNQSIQRLKAVFPNTPIDVTVTNITDSSLTISYITKDPVTGVISFGEKSNVDKIIYDDKDSDSKSKAHRIHYFTIKNLKANSTYYFNILSNNTLFDLNGSLYQIKTAPSLAKNTKSSKLLSGKIIMPDGNPPQEAVVYVKHPKSQIVSVLASNDGDYSLNLITLLNNNLTDYVAIDDNDVLTVNFKGDGMIAEATVKYKDTASIPIVTLSQEYNFTADLNATPTSTSSAQPTIPPFSKPKQAERPEIIIPEKNEPFNNPRPVFSGRGIANDEITISISAIEEIKASTNVNNDGEWSYRPDQKLEPGVYTLTITGKDKGGRTLSVSESFVMYAEGSQFSDPSVAPTKSPTPTISPTLIPTTTPLASPSATIIPSPTLSPNPTEIILPSFMPSQQPTIQPSITPPGSNELIISIGLITFATFISAMLFLLFRV